MSKALLDAFAKYSNEMMKSFFKVGIDVLETYFNETESNARIYVTVFNAIIKTTPVVKLLTIPDSPEFVVLNISPVAIDAPGLTYHDECFSFICRVNGRSVTVEVPYTAIVTIWSPDCQDICLHPTPPVDVLPNSPADKMLQQATTDVCAVMIDDSRPVKEKPKLSLVVDNKDNDHAKLH